MFVQVQALQQKVPGPRLSQCQPHNSTLHHRVVGGVTVVKIRKQYRSSSPRTFPFSILRAVLSIRRGIMQQSDTAMTDDTEVQGGAIGTTR